MEKASAMEKKGSQNLKGGRRDAASPRVTPEGAARRRPAGRVRKILPALLAAALLAAVLFFAWYRGAFLPRWIVWEEVDERAAEAYPRFARFQSSLTADLDHDGTEELVVLLWKHGRYADHKPFWTRRDTPRFVQHIFIYSEDLKPRWMSSGVPAPVARWEADEHGRIHLFTPEGEESVWEWNRFGLRLLG